MTMENLQKSLPDELIVEIILKLPAKYLSVKNLLQLRCVCKSWYRIIGNNSLINSAVISNASNNMYLICTRYDVYTLRELNEEDEEKDVIVRDSCSDLGKYYYTPKLFGINKRGCDSEIRVYGICEGLLCVSDSRLHVKSSIYLWNPVIRKAKKISMMMHKEYHQPGNADLCFGYFGDDYKVVKIDPSWGRYRVGVYSLRNDGWKVTYCASSYDTFWWLSNQSTNKFVNGVAYFVKYTRRIVCFDLHQERIREIQLPDDLVAQTNPFSVEPWGESIALIEIRRGHLTKWLLRNCAATNTYTWEKKVTVRLVPKFYMYPLGFTKHGKYLLRDDLGSSSTSMYLWDFGTQLEECKSEVVTQNLWAIDHLVGNFVLLEEKTLDPSVEMEPFSTQTSCVLYKMPATREDATEMLDPIQNRMKRSWSDKRILEHTGKEEPRKKGRKELLNKTQNKLQGWGARRKTEDRNEEAKEVVKKRNVGPHTEQNEAELVRQENHRTYRKRGTKKEGKERIVE